MFALYHLGRDPADGPMHVVRIMRSYLSLIHAGWASLYMRGQKRDRDAVIAKEWNVGVDKLMDLKEHTIAFTRRTRADVSVISGQKRIEENKSHIISGVCAAYKVPRIAGILTR